MRTIGITGGVGAGKSAILEYVEKNYNALVIVADKCAHELEKPGAECYDAIVRLLGREVLSADGMIDKGRMAAMIFGSEELRTGVNEIIHPAVKRHVTSVIEQEKKLGIHDYVIVEAALLIQDGYERILDELWYVRASEDVRRKRLKSTRSYSDEKIDSILESQMTDEEFARHCSVIIDNDGDLQEAYRQINSKLK